MIKKLLIHSLLVLLFTALISSCSKDKNTTPAELVANELSAVAKQNNLVRIYALKNNVPHPNQFPVNSGMNWTFSNGFFKYTYNTQYSYNLAYLVAYDIVNIRLENNTTERAMLLYFE